MELFNNRKNYGIAIIILTAVFSFAGCSKNFLDRERQGGYTEDTFPYIEGSGPYDSYLFGAYSDLRSFNVHSQSFIAATSYRSDDAEKGSTPADGGANALDFDNFPIVPSNSYTNTLWIGYFAIINKSNIALDQIHNNKDIEAAPDVKLIAEGEARFLRGYAYFMMVRLFGRVPIIDTVFSDPAAQSNVPQSQPAAIYSFIEADLQFAAANLPLSWDPKFIGRVTAGAAYGLLAKVYLTQQKWSDAMTAANMVIATGKYDLLTPYEKIFREDGENSSESVFEVQATANATIPQNNGVQYAQIQGVRGSNNFNMGWGWNTPSPILANAYEANDPRKNRTILFTSRRGQNGQPDTIYQSIYGETIPFDLPNRMYNNKVYTNPAMRTSIGNLFGYWMNVRILRYADVLLMYAEAANELNNTTEALAKLEAVRKRARGANNAILPPVTTTDQGELREAIRHERRIELAMEHDRFFDLVRWGIATEKLHAAGKTNYNDNRDRVLPIPQTQIDISQGVLTQNPNY